MRMLTVNEMRVQPAQQAILGVWAGLPWNFKMIAAFTSDTVPIFGRRRVPYLAIGLLLQLIAYFIMAQAVQDGGLLPMSLGALDFIQACGMVLLGTMSDTIIVETMKREDTGKGTFGNLQTDCWISIFVGQLIGSTISGHVHAALGTASVFRMAALLKVGMLTLPAMLQDPSVRQRPPCCNKNRGGGGCSAVVDEVIAGSNDPSVWHPVLFLFVFAACPQNTDAWNSFLFGEPVDDGSSLLLANSTNSSIDATATDDGSLQPLALPEEVLGYIGAVTTVAQALGALFYRLCLKRFTLRRLFLVIVVASSLLQLTQLILITRANVAMGLPDVAFAIGDDAIIEVSRELLAMPMMVMMAALCPNKAASTVFALLTSVQMAGQTLSGSLSSGLTGALGIKLEDYSRMWLLTLLCSTLRLCTVFLLGLVPPRNPREVELKSEGRLDSGEAETTPRDVELYVLQTDAPMLPAQEREDAAGRRPAVDAQQSAERPRHGRKPIPRGTLLLFTLIVASLLWSLYKMFSSL